MANVTTIPIVSSSGTGGNFDASAMWNAGSSGGNYQRIAYQVNGQLNSVNFKTSSFLSQHIGINAIQGVQITGVAVKSSHVSQTAIMDRHMRYQSGIGDLGVRAVRIGEGGLKIARATVHVSGTVAATGGGMLGSAISARVVFSASTSASFSDARHTITYTASIVDGSPGFTTTPTIAAAPGVDAAGAAYNWGDGRFTSINSAQADFQDFMIVGFSGGINHTYNLQIVGF